jgi:hypothetical protein
VPWRVASHRIASHRLASPHLVYCQATAINTCMTQDRGRVTWQLQQWRHAFQQWRNNWSTVGRSVSRVSDQGFIGESEASPGVVVIGESSVGVSRVRFVVEEDFVWAVVKWVRENNSGSKNSAVQVSSRRELWRMLLWRENLCVIFGVWDGGSFCLESRCWETTIGDWKS